MGGSQEDIDAVKQEIADLQKSRLTAKKNTVIQLNTVLNDENASAIKVYEFLNRSLGTDWWEWEWETIEQILFIRYGVALTDVNRDKILAIRHLCQSDKAFHDWFEFNQLALSFSGAVADFEMLRSPSPGMMINAVKCMNYIRPDRDGYFGEDTLKYICVALYNEGIYIPPPSILLTVKKYMSRIVSDDVKKQWMKILKKYNAIVSGKDKDVAENIVDIQAKRLVNAEAAALTYSE